MATGRAGKLALQETALSVPTTERDEYVQLFVPSAPGRHYCISAAGISAAGMDNLLTAEDTIIWAFFVDGHTPDAFSEQHLQRHATVAAIGRRRCHSAGGVLIGREGVGWFTYR